MRTTNLDRQTTMTLGELLGFCMVELPGGDLPVIVRAHDVDQDVTVSGQIHSAEVEASHDEEMGDAFVIDAFVSDCQCPSVIGTLMGRCIRALEAGADPKMVVVARVYDDNMGEDVCGGAVETCICSVGDGQRLFMIEVTTDCVDPPKAAAP